MQLTPEQINEFIAKSVLESQIGKAVQDSTKRVFEQITRSYDNPFDMVIKRHVSDMIEKTISEKYTEQIRQRVQEGLATALTDEVVGKIVSAAIEKINSRY